MNIVKREYIKPELLVYTLDNEISLQMASDVQQSAGQTSFSEPTGTYQASANPFDSNPFEEN